MKPSPTRVARAIHAQNRIDLLGPKELARVAQQGPPEEAALAQKALARFKKWHKLLWSR